jgi:O-antigen/teichoic acid export membrane protein
LLGIVIPALMNGLSIPVFKNILGATAYGQYALYFNALLIANLLASGWLSQAILRFYAKWADKISFTGQVIKLAFLVGAILFLPSAGIVWLLSGSLPIGFLFGVLLWLAAVQLPLQSLAQSSFLSKAAAVAEALRTVTWLGLSLTFLKLKIPFLPALLVAIAISYFVSIAYLYKKNRVVGLPQLLKKNGRLSYEFYRYGWPFSLWFIFYYLSGYIDKIFLLRYAGSNMQGNYSAVYDFITKSAGLVLAPVLTAAVPLLTEAFEKQEFYTVKRLIRKLVTIELIALFVLLAAYSLGGYRILFWLLRIPPEAIYMQSGFLITAGIMLWQIAFILQKTQELRYQSISLLAKIAVAIGLQLALYFIFPCYLPIIFPTGFCLAALLYLLQIRIIELRQKNRIPCTKQ